MIYLPRTLCLLVQETTYAVFLSLDKVWQFSMLFKQLQMNRGNPCMQVLSRMVIEFLFLMDPNMGAHLLALGLEHNLAERSLLTNYVPLH